MTLSICDVEVPSCFHCLCAHCGDQKMMLARNIDYRSILQKTLQQFEPVASKYERSKIETGANEQLSVRITLQTSFFMFLLSAFQFGFLQSKPFFFPLKSIWNSFYTVENSNLAWRFPADGSKFQFDPYYGPKYNVFFTRTALSCLYGFLLVLRTCTYRYTCASIDIVLKMHAFFPWRYFFFLARRFEELIIVWLVTH